MRGQVAFALVDGRETKTGAFSEDTSGLVRRRASRTYWSAKEDDTCGVAMARLKELTGSETGAMLQVCYVVDREGRLVGCAAVTTVASADPTALMSQVMSSRTIPIPEGAPEEAIQDFFVTYGLNSFPVVDKEKRLVGVVGVEHFSDLVFEGFEEQLREEMCRSVGLTTRDENNPSVMQAARVRFPWLGVTLAGGLVAALLVSQWIPGGLERALPTLLFLPLVVMLTERVTQRILVLRTTWAERPGSARREFLSETLLALAVGVVAAFLVYLWKYEPRVGLAVGAAGAAAVIIGTTVGLLFPVNERGAKEFLPTAVPIALAVADVCAVAALVLFTTLALAQNVP